MAKENVEYMQGYSPERLPLGTVRQKEDQETEEDGKQKRVKWKVNWVQK